MENFKNSRRVGADLNIHVPVQGELLGYIRSINRPIVSAGFRDVSFASSSAQIPHVTLLMGKLSSPENLPAVMECVGHTAQLTEGFSFRVTPPFLVAPENQFCFVGIEEAERFFDLKRSLASRLKRLMTFAVHGGPDNPPHITFGYFNKPQKALETRSKQVYRKTSRASHLEVSPARVRGTCAEVLLRAPFKP